MADSMTPEQHTQLMSALDANLKALMALIREVHDMRMDSRNREKGERRFWSKMTDGYRTPA